MFVKGSFVPSLTLRLTAIMFVQLGLAMVQPIKAQAQASGLSEDSSGFQSAVTLPEDTAKPVPSDNSQWVEASVNDLRQTNQQWIQVDLSDQRLTAWEGDTPVFSIIVSTGRELDATPTGVYSIQDKYRTARMQGEHQGQRYDIPDVPYTMYFSGSYAIHGAYWHDNFGNPVSSGCINVPVQGAAWLFDWAGVGTSVIVQN